MDSVWLFGIKASHWASDLLLRVPRRGQSTVEYGLTLLAVASAGLALWVLLGPAIQQLGERLVTQVNSIK
jgi:hypothetical protein